MVFEDSIGTAKAGPLLDMAATNCTLKSQSLPPAIYVRDRMSINGTWIDNGHRIGHPSYATPGYLLRHGQRVSILGEGYEWVFELYQPATAHLQFADEEMRHDNEVRRRPCRIRGLFFF